MTDDEMIRALPMVLIKALEHGTVSYGCYRQKD
jgi:hypothetical protein